MLCHPAKCLLGRSVSEGVKQGDRSVEFLLHRALARDWKGYFSQLLRSGMNMHFLRSDC
jgi:hypothetical protein